MPDVAADTDEGVLAAWLVEESARFDAAQTIAYVETQEELFSVEAGRPGVLLRALVEPGATVEPGTPIGILGEPSEPVEDLEGLLAALGVARMAAAGVAEQLDDSVSRHRAGPSRPEVQHQQLRARVRVDRLVALASRLDRNPPGPGVEDLVDRAVIAAHRQVPELGYQQHGPDGSRIPVTHPGRFGVAEAAAVVPPGEAAVLAVGQVCDEPVVESAAVVPGKVMVLTLSLAADRVAGAAACRWFAVLVGLLERPEWMLD